MYYFIKQNTQYRCFNFKYVLSFVFVISIFLSINPIKASSVKIVNKYQKLNAEYKEVENKEAPFFLILHGTFAWHGMELINALQENLNNEGYGSLALTLSLSEDNRNQFYDCSHSIISKHEDAQEELNIWLTWLEKKGYKNIQLIGHSRGGAQVVEFALNQSKRVNEIFLLAPMVWEKEKTALSFYQHNKKKLSDVLTKVKTQTNSELLTIKRALHCENTKISSEAFISYYDLKPIKNTIDLLAKIESPVHIYLGDSDPLTSSFNKQYSKTEKEKRIVVKVIEDADHFFRDFAAEDIVEDIISSTNN